MVAAGTEELGLPPKNRNLHNLRHHRLNIGSSACREEFKQHSNQAGMKAKSQLVVELQKFKLGKKQLDQFDRQIAVTCEG